MAKLLRPAKEPRAPGTADPPAGERPAKTAAPKPKRDAGLAWLVLLGLLVVAAIPLLIDLSKPAVWDQGEAEAILIAAETHNRKAPLSDSATSLEKWTPVYQGTTRWDKPPAGVWLHQLMFPDLPAEGPPTLKTKPTSDKLLVTRARLGSVIMALLFVAAVFWCGHTIGGVTTGALSAMVAMTMPLLVGFGRHAHPHSAAMAWSTLSIAGALWAMRPLRASPSLIRQLVGWIVCGLGLAAATLTIGPTALPATVLCTIALAMVCPRRIGHIMGLLASTAFAALMLAPWVLHVHEQDPKIWTLWVSQIAPDLTDVGLLEALRRAGWRLSLAATLSGLWLVWLIPAVSQPFSTSTGQARRKLLLGWVWLLTAVALLAFAPGPTSLAGLLMAVAPASVAVGLVIQQFHDLSGEGRHARLWQVCRWLACALMLVLGVALPLVGFLLQNKPDLVAWLPSLQRPLLAPMHWSFYLGTGTALVLTAALAIRFAYANHPGPATACLALWLMVTYCTAIIPISRGQYMSTPTTPPPAAQTSHLWQSP